MTRIRRIAGLAINGAGLVVALSQMARWHSG